MARRGWRPPLLIKRVTRVFAKELEGLAGGGFVLVKRLAGTDSTARVGPSIVEKHCDVIIPDNVRLAIGFLLRPGV